MLYLKFFQFSVRFYERFQGFRTLRIMGKFSQSLVDFPFTVHQADF